MGSRFQILEDFVLEVDSLNHGVGNSIIIDEAMIKGYEVNAVTNATGLVSCANRGVACSVLP